MSCCKRLLTFRRFYEKIVFSRTIESRSVDTITDHCLRDKTVALSAGYPYIVSSAHSPAVHEQAPALLLSGLSKVTVLSTVRESSCTEEDGSRTKKSGENPRNAHNVK